MPSVRKILDSILSGRSDANTRFADLRRLLLAMGFGERVKSSHHIFFREPLPEILNLQSLPGGAAKPYQVKQVRQIVLEYKLSLPERRS